MPVADLGPLWRELGANMRQLRRFAELSLRDVEALSGWPRGTLSQVENGKTRPGHELVQWYDDRFASDGLLLSLLAEARAGAPVRTVRQAAAPAVEGDAMRVLDHVPASGWRVSPGERLAARWTLCNAGAVVWTRRRLARLGSSGGARLLASIPFLDIPQVNPGDHVSVGCDVQVPDYLGTLAAYWHMVDEARRPVFADSEPLSLIVVVA